MKCDSLVQAIQTLLAQNSSVLFLAPTGWGKTTMLLELAKSSNKSIIYLSPLRALANEFHLRAIQAKLNAFAPRTRKELSAVLTNGLEFKLLILTAELFYEKALEELIEGKIIVFDEFHLFYYWGRDFRPKLLELYDITAITSQASLMLTATASEEVVDFWRDSSRYQPQYLIDLGNQRIKKEPKAFFNIPKRMAVNYLQSAPSGVKLVFCKYRKEAKSFADEYSSKGFSTLSCVSGEVEEFQEKLTKVQNLDFIFCTSTLSHGVNLPEISCLFILYQVGNLDLWLQMAGRAGRKGEEFTLVSVDGGNRSPRARLFSRFSFLCRYYICHYWVKNLRRFINAFGRHYYS